MKERVSALEQQQVSIVVNVIIVVIVVSIIMVNLSLRRACYETLLAFQSALTPGDKDFRQESPIVNDD